MCFSATASFVSAGIVGAAGILSLSKVETPNQKYFAAIPLVFAVQQIAEGFVWISFNSVATPTWQDIPIKIFLFFAIVVWPTLVPYSVWKFEENKKRKRFQFVFLTAGLIFSTVAAWYMFNYSSSASIAEHHVYYKLDFPLRNAPIVSIFYIGATVVSLLLSSKKWVPGLGLLILSSYIVTNFYYKDYLISVWCFFAAVLSALIYLMVTHRIKVFEPKTT
ncbi:MAG: hypothetical protein JNM96_02405 [Bacteroidia bacterium]|nr:hypothetical protein [Bacteroidia bacterium]